MNFLKKAKSHMESVAGDAQILYAQYKHQQQNAGSQTDHVPNHSQQWSLPGYPPTPSQSNAEGNHYPPNATYSHPSMSQGPYVAPDYHNHYYNHISSLPTPPAEKAYDMASLDHALPHVAPRPMPASSFLPSPPHRDRQIQVIPSSMPAYTGPACPRFEPALVERIQFYTFKHSILRSANIEAENFAICNACFTTHIAQHAFLAESFEAYEPPRSEADEFTPNSLSFLCDLAMPTALRILYRDCIPRHSISSLLQFAQLALPPCSGELQQESADIFRSSKVEGFVVCRTCFEMYVRGTVFERDMEPGPVDSGWFCDIGIKGFIFRALTTELLDTQKPDFGRFAIKAAQRMSVDSCPGDGIPIAPEGSRKRHYVYEPPDGDTGVFCEACFLDKVQGTRVEQSFNKHVMLGDEFYGTLACDLASSQSTFAMKVAARNGDGETWRRCLVGRNSSPSCMGIEGVDEESLQSSTDPALQWWCVIKQPSIEVCPYCYTAVVELLGAESLFSPIDRPLKPGVTRMCFLSQAQDLSAQTDDSKNFENTLVWRGTILRNWLHHGFDLHGDFSGFKRAVDVIASLAPPCITNKRAIKPASGRKWYGNHFLAEGDEAKVGIAVCEECYSNCIKGTPLEWFAGVDITERIWSKNPDGFVCNTWTPRARSELRSACESGRFLDFAAYWAARCDCERRWKEIDALCQTQAEKQAQMLSRINMQNHLAAMNLMQQLNAHQNAIITGVGGSVAEAAAPDYGQRFGNSAVGYGYLTAGGANAAQAHLDAQAFASQSRKVSLADYRESGDTWQDTQAILALAKAVEQEWNDIR